MTKSEKDSLKPGETRRWLKGLRVGEHFTIRTGAVVGGLIGIIGPKGLESVSAMAVLHESEVVGEGSK